MDENENKLNNNDENLERDENASQKYFQTRINRKQQERYVRKTNLWMRRLRALLRFVFILLLIFLCYKIIRMKQWYMSPKAFDNVNSPYIEILNNKIVPDNYILSALRQSKVPTVPIYMYDTSELKESLLKLDPVDNVFIRRFWYPARLQIIIQESVPIIIICPDENSPAVAFFTKSGKLIGRDYLPLNKSYQTIKVLTYGNRGDDYRHWDKSRVDSIEKIGKLIKAVSKEQLDYIDLRIPNDTYIQLKGIKIRLGKLDDTVGERIKRIPSIIPQIQTLDKKIKYVDLRWKDANYIKLED